MTEIVSNTGPLIALCGIERVDLLWRLFDRVLVPTAVYNEMLAGEMGKAVFLQACSPDRLTVMEPEPQADPLLTSMLDEGEAAVIRLARAQSIERVLIDERKGRKVARGIYGLQPWGTARILLEAKAAGMLATVQPELERMRGNGYRIHDNIVRTVLELAGE